VNLWQTPNVGDDDRSKSFGKLECTLVAAPKTHETNQCRSIDYHGFSHQVVIVFDHGQQIAANSIGDDNSKTSGMAQFGVAGPYDHHNRQKRRGQSLNVQCWLVQDGSLG
jgi:hypothetical protein